MAIPANPKRIGLIIYNNSANSAYLAYGVSGDAGAKMTRILAMFSQFVMEYPIYTGAIWARRNSGSGTLAYTELEE